MKTMLTMMVSLDECCEPAFDNVYMILFIFVPSKQFLQLFVYLCDSDFGYECILGNFIDGVLCFSFMVSTDEQKQSP